MSKKWSQKTEKLTLVADDEFMILDSQDANPATNSKRVKMSTAGKSVFNSFEFQTVGATTQQQAFLFTGAITVRVMIAANNAGNSKGLSADILVNCTVTNTNNVNQNVVSDFATANVSVATAVNSVTFTLTGEAGETINWKGSVLIVII
jgi:hypothetical protein